MSSSRGTTEPATTLNNPDSSEAVVDVVSTSRNEGLDSSEGIQLVERGEGNMFSTEGASAPASRPPTPATPFVLVDVEGTQSRDRGVDGTEFDSR